MNKKFSVAAVILLVIFFIFIGIKIGEYLQNGAGINLNLNSISDSNKGDKSGRRIFEIVAKVIKINNDNLELEISVPPLSENEKEQKITRIGRLTSSTVIKRNVPKDGAILAKEIEQAQKSGQELPKPYTEEVLSASAIKAGSMIMIKSGDNIIIANPLTLQIITVY